MKAAKIFIEEIISLDKFNEIDSIKCDFYGSLALTGKGHGTDKAFILGIQGYDPVTIDSNKISTIIENVTSIKKLEFNYGENNKHIDFNPKKDIKFHRRINLPYHPNGMCFAAFDSSGEELFKKVYYSIGGGFVIDETEVTKKNVINPHQSSVKYPFKSAEDLLILTQEHQKSISELIFENELTWRDEKTLKEDALKLWVVMQKCVDRGFHNEGILPGGLKVKRRAPKIYQQMMNSPEQLLSDSLGVMDWVNLYALSVNEENAAGGQVVTAPTNGAAGIIPAVLHYYRRFCPGSSDDGVLKFLLTAGAIGILYKTNASISGAEVGCQGEVGVACSMAAGALCEVLGGTPEQVENAAEIAMEHNLGLTCDPIGGLVQIPCIERNAMGAIKAINASRIALRGDGTHFVSLDKVIKTMKQTGKDMKKQYKETSRGGLAVNITEC